MSSSHAKAAAHPPASPGVAATPAASAASSTAVPVLKRPAFVGGLMSFVLLLFVAFVAAGLAYQFHWFGWGKPAETTAEKMVREAAEAAERARIATEMSVRQAASPEGSAEAKSGSSIPDVSRGVSDVLSGIPALLFGVTKKQDPPRPPGTVYEMWVRPGVIVWAGKISRSQPSPWFEVMETVFAAIDTDGEGVQRKEFFPGNPHIFRWVEQESDTPLPAAAFGEEVP